MTIWSIPVLLCTAAMLLWKIFAWNIRRHQATNTNHVVPLHFLRATVWRAQSRGRPVGSPSVFCGNDSSLPGYWRWWHHTNIPGPQTYHAVVPAVMRPDLPTHTNKQPKQQCCVFVLTCRGRPKGYDYHQYLDLRNNRGSKQMSMWPCCVLSGMLNKHTYWHASEWPETEPR